MKRYPRLLKFLRRALLALAVLATLLALGIVVENWRGDRAWAAVERDLRARGEPLDLAAFQTPRIPDERNFFKAPALENLLYAKQDDPQNKKLLADTKLSEIAAALSYRNDRDGDREVLKMLLKSKLLLEPLSPNPATDILAAVKPAEALLDAVVQAARDRPEAWLSADLPLLPVPDQRQPNHRAALELTRALTSRAMAELALGQNDAAAADIAGILGFARCFAAAAGPLHAVTGTVIQRMAIQALKKGLAQHLWTDGQLAAFQQQLEKIRPLALLKLTLQARRVWAIQLMSLPPNATPDGSRLWPRWLITGWVQQNKAAFAKNTDELLAAFDSTANRIFPDRIRALQNINETMRASRSPYAWLAGRIGGHTEAEIVNSGFAANNHTQAVVACALERFRLARGVYPATLTELVPAFVAAVPQDVYSGQPMSYARAPDGGYVLTASDIGSHSDEELEWTQPGAR